MRILPLLFFACLSLIVPFEVHAQLINEVSPLSTPDWVEIFLSADASAVSLEGMTLVDSAGNTKKLEGTLAPGTYLAVEWSNKLNNKGDTVSLFRGNERIDLWEYGDTCKPEGSETLGKQNGNMVRLKVATKGAPNTTDFVACSTNASPEPKPTAAVVETPTPTLKQTSPPTMVPIPSTKPLKTAAPQPSVLSATIPTDSPAPSLLPARSTSPFLFFIPVGMGITAYGIRELVKSIKSHI